MPSCGARAEETVAPETQAATPTAVTAGGLESGALSGCYVWVEDSGDLGSGQDVASPHLSDLSAHSLPALMGFQGQPRWGFLRRPLCRLGPHPQPRSQEGGAALDRSHLRSVELSAGGASLLCRAGEQVEGALRVGGLESGPAPPPPLGVRLCLQRPVRSWICRT